MPPRSTSNKSETEKKAKPQETTTPLADTGGSNPTSPHNKSNRRSLDHLLGLHSASFSTLQSQGINIGAIRSTAAAGPSSGSDVGYSSSTLDGIIAIFSTGAASNFLLGALPSSEILPGLDWNSHDLSAVPPVQGPHDALVACHLLCLPLWWATNPDLTPPARSPTDEAESLSSTQGSNNGSFVLSTPTAQNGAAKEALCDLLSTLALDTLIRVEGALASLVKSIAQESYTKAAVNATTRAKQKAHLRVCLMQDGCTVLYGLKAVLLTGLMRGNKAFSEGRNDDLAFLHSASAESLLSTGELQGDAQAPSPGEKFLSRLAASSAGTEIKTILHGLMRRFGHQTSVGLSSVSINNRGFGTLPEVVGHGGVLSFCPPVFTPTELNNHSKPTNSSVTQVALPGELHLLFGSSSTGLMVTYEQHSHLEAWYTKVSAQKVLVREADEIVKGYLSPVADGASVIATELGRVIRAKGVQGFATVVAKNKEVASAILIFLLTVGGGSGDRERPQDVALATEMLVDVVVPVNGICEATCHVLQKLATSRMSGSSSSAVAGGSATSALLDAVVLDKFVQSSLPLLGSVTDGASQGASPDQQQQIQSQQRCLKLFSVFCQNLFTHKFPFLVESVSALEQFCVERTTVSECRALFAAVKKWQQKWKRR